jgi:hypothetical protein
MSKRQKQARDEPKGTGMTVIVRHKDQAVPDVSAVANNGPVANMIRQIEGEAHNGSIYALQNFDLFCAKHGENPNDWLSPQRVEELQKLSIKTIKRIKELTGSDLAIQIEKAVIVAKGLGKPDALHAVLAGITADDRRSKKIRTLIFPADEAMRVFDPGWQKQIK